MAPAFSSVRQAAAFALLLLLILLSPLLVGKNGLPPRRDIYSSISWLRGGFPYIAHQIFDEKSDIDIAFVGSSHLYCGIDTPYVQRQLSARLGRPATVVTLGWYYPGFDAVYFIGRELLEHRKVRLLVFYDDVAPNWPHNGAWRWVRVGDNAADIAGLPLRFRAAYYFGSIIAMPRDLLSRLRPNLAADASADSFHRDYPDVIFPPDRLGAFTTQFNVSSGAKGFVPRVPVTSASPADVLVYAPDNRDKFRFESAPLPPFQAYYAKKFVALARAHSTRLVCLDLPVLSDAHDDAVPLSRLWPDYLQPDAALVGIVPTRFFQGLDRDEIDNIFGDPAHLNANGQAYFTRLVTPALLRLYEESPR